MSKKTKNELQHDVENLSAECDKLKAKVFELEHHNEVISSNFNVQAKDVDYYIKISDRYKKEIDRLTMELEKGDVIDYGTGKLHYLIEKGSVMVLNELMQCLKETALVVPLPALIKHIKNAPGYPAL